MSHCSLFLISAVSLSILAVKTLKLILSLSLYSTIKTVQTWYLSSVSGPTGAQIPPPDFELSS